MRLTPLPKNPVHLKVLNRLWRVRYPRSPDKSVEEYQERLQRKLDKLSNPMDEFTLEWMNLFTLAKDLGELMETTRLVVSALRGQSELLATLDAMLTHGAELPG